MVSPLMLTNTFSCCYIRNWIHQLCFWFKYLEWDYVAIRSQVDTSSTISIVRLHYYCTGRSGAFVWRRSSSRSLSKTMVQPFLLGNNHVCNFRWSSDDIYQPKPINVQEKNTSCFEFHFHLHSIWLTFLGPESRLKTMCNNNSNVSQLFLVRQ